MQTGHSWMCDMSQKAAPGKQTGELLITMHAHAQYVACL